MSKNMISPTKILQKNRLIYKELWYFFIPKEMLSYQFWCKSISKKISLYQFAPRLLWRHDDEALILRLYVVFSDVFAR